MKKVIIVGAGLAGLAAAYELSKNPEVQTVVFEARPHVGGRVYSKEINGHMVDFGGFIVYPWYREYHRLVRELGLQDQLVRLPFKKIYYELEPGQFLAENQISTPLRERVRIGWAMLSKLLHKNELGHPDLNFLKRQTVAEYLRETFGSETPSFYEHYMDVITQGYCYAPLTEYKMAFVAPIMRNLILRGNIKKSSFFSGKASLLTQSLAAAIEENGGSVRLSEPVTRVDGQSVETPSGWHDADAIIFAQPAHEELYKEILLDTSFQCRYTHFYSAVLKLDKHPVVSGDSNWAAVFYDQHEQKKYEVLTSVNLAALHGPVHEGYVNVNIIARVPTGKAASKAELLAYLEPQFREIYPDAQVLDMVELIHWPEAMPVAQEEFVETIRQAQGRNGYYFAGDFLGAPSMEAALETGVRAAETVLRDE